MSSKATESSLKQIPTQLCASLLFFLLLVCASVLSGQSKDSLVIATEIGIYQADSTFQCNSLPGKAMDVSAKALLSKKIKVISQEKRPLPNAQTAECGAPTGMVNYFLIDRKDLSRVNLDPSSKGAFRIWGFEMKTVMVGKRSSLERCKADSSHLAKFRKELVSVRVFPLEQKLAPPPSTYRSACDPKLGDSYVYTIPADQLADARKKSFYEALSPYEGRCAHLVIPQPGTPEAKKVRLPESWQMILPPVRSPSRLSNIPIKVYFFVAFDGIVDSVDTTLPETETFRTEFNKLMKTYAWKPAVYNGCPIPWVGIITVTLNH